MNTSFENYWGIDVSKEWLDIDVGEKNVRRLIQSKGAIQRFIAQHPPRDGSQTLVCLESTGGYEQEIVQALSRAGFRVHVAHPSRVKAFARAQGRLAKTDKIDARVLRAYGSFLSVEDLRPLPSAAEEALSLLSTRLEQLKAMHHQESCRLALSREPLIKKSIQALLALLKKQMARLEHEMDKAIQAQEDLKEKEKILRSMKGVGPTLARKLITDLPELGKANKKEIAALVGVAPITHSSGQKRGKAMIKYGRSAVRKILYMGALTASRYNPILQTFYKKLRAVGKAPKVALVAVMRKMLVILNAMVQSKTPFVLDN